MQDKWRKSVAFSISSRDKRNLDCSSATSNILMYEWMEIHSLRINLLLCKRSTRWFISSSDRLRIWREKREMLMNIILHITNFPCFSQNIIQIFLCFPFRNLWNYERQAKWIISLNRCAKNQFVRRYKRVVRDVTGLICSDWSKIIFIFRIRSVTRSYRSYNKWTGRADKKL